MSMVSTRPAASTSSDASFRRVYAVVGGLVLIVWLVASVMGLRSGRTVTPCYERASQAWIQGTDLYDSTGRNFLYLPQSAVLYTPFALLPATAEEFAWRLFNVAVFAVALVRFARLMPGLTPHGFALLSLICVVMGVNVLRNGQMTLPMTAVMLLACESVAAQAWRRAAFWMLLAVAMKPLAICLPLLAGAVYPPLRRTLVVGAVLLALMPFATQHPDYVIGQYQSFWRNLVSANELGADEWWKWSQFFSMLSVVKINVASQTQTLIRGAAALAFLGLWYVAKRGCEPRRSAVYLFAFSALYLTIFNPRTENSTYFAIAPAIGLFVVAETTAGRGLRATLLGFLVVGCAASYEIGKYFTPVWAKPIWLAPLCACLFTIYLLRELFHDVTAARSLPTSNSADDRPLQRRAA